MAISDLAASIRAGKDLPWRTCQVCHALATIPAEEAEGLRELLRGTMRYTEIRELIAADEDTPLDLHEDALSRHARGRCEAREKLR